MKPSTTERATSSRFPIRASTTGSTKRAPGIADVANPCMLLTPGSGLEARGSGADFRAQRRALRDVQERQASSFQPQPLYPPTSPIVAPAPAPAAGPRGLRAGRPPAA